MSTAELEVRGTTTIPDERPNESAENPPPLPPLPEQLKAGAEVIDRSRNLRHLVALQRVLNVLRLRRFSQPRDSDPPPPLSH